MHPKPLDLALAGLGVYRYSNFIGLTPYADVLSPCRALSFVAY